MASGCDFICQNEKCEHYKKGIVMLAPWPLGDIDKIMTLPHVVKNKDFLKELQGVKDSGQKYSCINYPNTKNIQTVGYRVHLWCQQCPCLLSYDVMLSDKITSADSALNEAPIKCPQCTSRLKPLIDLLGTDDGIYCPHCKQKMEKNTWFSNETNEDIF